MRVYADQDRCVAAGQCVLSAGLVFDQRESDGIVVLLDDDPPSQLQAAVRRASDLCPSGAIRILDTW
jgi:ferredoxin